MRPQIIVLGSHGMLGREVMKAAGDEAIGCYLPHVDIRSAVNVRGVIGRFPGAVVINCAGLTKHRVPEPTALEYRQVNGIAPLMLARECDAIGARLIHVSTDCVFSGARPIEDGPYTEVHTPDPIDEYGKSKAFGEVVRAPHLTVRCSFVGLGERGLIAWLRTAERVELWRRVYWSGSTAPAIARALVELAQRPEVMGLMHLAGDGTTKSHLIHEIWRAGLARSVSCDAVDEPRLNRWLASNRDDVPELPPLDVALRELAG